VRDELVQSIQRYFDVNMDEKIGNIAAGGLLGQGIMKTAGIFLTGLASLGIGFAAMAGEPVATVVSIHYSVRENNPEKLVEAVTNPVERSMRELDRVAKIGSTTSHGVVEVQIEFQDNATAQDLAVVTAQVEKLKFDQDVAILSRTIELGSRNPLIWP
jgi:hypothetical protein